MILASEWIHTQSTYVPNVLLHLLMRTIAADGRVYIVFRSVDACVAVNGRKRSSVGAALTAPSRLMFWRERSNKRLYSGQIVAAFVCSWVKDVGATTEQRQSARQICNIQHSLHKR